MFSSHKIKIFIGIVISALFLFLSISKVDFSQMVTALDQAKYKYIISAVAVMIFSHLLRAFRWRYLLKPIQQVSVFPLFNSLIIGYMFNVILPAHLGEFVRAYILGKKKALAAGAVFGTIVIERIIDVCTLLIIMAITIELFPFPEWVRTSSSISFIFIAALFIGLLLMKRDQTKATVLILAVTKPFPVKFRHKLEAMLHSVLDGIIPLKKRIDYVIVVILSITIWAAYAYVFQLVLHAFNFFQVYYLPWYTSFVLLVITTISIIVPSSPGYVGTYHYLCQLSLAFFTVPASPALSFAVIMHALNFLPVLVLGLVLISFEGVSIKSLRDSKEIKGEITNR